METVNKKIFIWNTDATPIIVSAITKEEAINKLCKTYETDKKYYDEMNMLENQAQQLCGNNITDGSIIFFLASTGELSESIMLNNDTHLELGKLLNRYNYLKSMLSENKYNRLIHDNIYDIIYKNEPTVFDLSKENICYY